MNHLFVNKAFELAKKVHAGQFRNDGVTPFLNHVQQVVTNVYKRGGGDLEGTVAWLHDTVEDTDTTIEEIRTLFDDKIAEAVDALTHRPGESYPDAIDRARANPIARKVKIADNLANLSDEPSDKQIMKYAKSLQVLMT